MKRTAEPTDAPPTASALAGWRPCSWRLSGAQRGHPDARPRPPRRPTRPGRARPRRGRPVRAMILGGRSGPGTPPVKSPSTARSRWQRCPACPNCPQRQPRRPPRRSRLPPASTPATTAEPPLSTPRADERAAVASAIQTLLPPDVLRAEPRPEAESPEPARTALLGVSCPGCKGGFARRAAVPPLPGGVGGCGCDDGGCGGCPTGRDVLRSRQRRRLAPVGPFRIQRSRL